MIRVKFILKDVLHNQEVRRVGIGIEDLPSQVGPAKLVFCGHSSVDENRIDFLILPRYARFFYCLEFYDKMN